MAKVVDLDALGLEDIEVKLKGETYKLPPDIPVPTMLYFIDLEEQIQSDDEESSDYTDLLRTMYNEVLDLFLEVEENREKLFVEEVDGEPQYRLNIGMAQIPLLFAQVTALYNAAPEADAARPTPAKTPSGRSSRPSRGKGKSAKSRATSRS